MTPDEQELAKQGIEVAFSPVRDFFAKLLGQPAEEVGATLTDAIRVHRWKRSLKLLEDVRREAADLGIEPGRVPLKTLLPILEGASLEEDEDMHERWKWLLLNASNPQSDIDVPPLFPEMLKQLSPQDAKFLDNLYQREMTDSLLRRRYEHSDLKRLYCHAVGMDPNLLTLDTPTPPPPTLEISFAFMRFKVSLHTLISVGLIERNPIFRASRAYTVDSFLPVEEFREEFQLSPLGLAFMGACRK